MSFTRRQGVIAPGGVAHPFAALYAGGQCGVNFNSSFPFVVGAAATYESVPSVTSFAVTGGGRVGIGTLSPTSALHVSGSDPTVIIQGSGATTAAGGDAYLRLAEDGSFRGGFLRASSSSPRGLCIGMHSSATTLLADDTVHLFVDEDNGNVSIGRGHAVGDEKLDVNGAVCVEGGVVTLSSTAQSDECLISASTLVTGSLVLHNQGFTSYIAGLNHPVVYSSNASFGSETGSSSLVLQGGDGGGVVLRTADTERVRVAADGKVGVGVASPTAQLDVRGGKTIIDTVALGASARHTNWAYFGHKDLNDDTQYALLFDTTGYALLNSSGTGYIQLRHNNTALMTFSSTGMVGLGTASPGYRLTVGQNTSASVDEEVRVQSRRFAGVRVDGDTANLSGEPGGAYLRLSQDGDLVAGAVSLVQIAGGDGIGGSVANSSGNGMLVGTKNSNNIALHLCTNNNVRMTILGNGNVGIGTTTPNVKLVASRLKINGGWGNPANGTNGGGSGYRLILWTGSASGTPYGVGVGTGDSSGGALWFGVPTSAQHLWFGGTHSLMRLREVGGRSELDLNRISYPQTHAAILSSIRWAGSGDVSISTTSWTQVRSHTFTLVNQPDCMLMASFDCHYGVGGNGWDDWEARITVVNGSTTHVIAKVRHFWRGQNGGGTRSGTLFPLIGCFSYTSAMTSVTFRVEVRRHNSDDVLTVHQSTTEFPSYLTVVQYKM